MEAARSVERLDHSRYRFPDRVCAGQGGAARHQRGAGEVLGRAVVAVPRRVDGDPAHPVDGDRALVRRRG